jgi:dihydroxy-acid dehydratase
MELNKYSKTITQDETQNIKHKCCNGRGFNRKIKQGIVSMGYEGNTCNMHLNDLAKDIKKAYGKKIVDYFFNTWV